ncbi:major facilitator superfamily domain-containing protein [Aspergillus parasiticus]|uniref:Major facilitator superfamily domain-containing protein n=1 Tax=Aspergillus parasiticus TaxID=5067 RepID=A0A5N6E481_ASPPA|nr:major facilitator superfamily domain-containing protein [Aspergillus parasiticus]
MTCAVGGQGRRYAVSTLTEISNSRIIPIRPSERWSSPAQEELSSPANLAGAFASAHSQCSVFCFPHVQLCGLVSHHAKKDIVLWSGFRNLLFLGMVLSNFFLVTSLFIPMFYLPTYAERAHGMPQQLSLYLVAMLTGGSFFGRIVLGMAADRLFDRLNVLGVSGLATGIMCFCWTRAHSVGAIIVFFITHDFTSGAAVSKLSACFAQIPKDRVALGHILGWACSVQRLGL